MTQPEDSKKKSTYRITVRTITDQVLTFTKVQNYSVDEGYLVFKDSKTGERMRFAVSNTQIAEEVSR